MSALRLASSPVRITIYREDPESIFTSYEGNECFHNNLKFIDLIAGNTYHPHIIIPFCLLVIFLLIVTFIFEDISWTTPLFSWHPTTHVVHFLLAEPSAIFEVNLVKSITDYIGLSILARKYVFIQWCFVKKASFLSFFSLFPSFWTSGQMKDKRHEIFTGHFIATPPIKNRGRPLDT